MFSIYIPYVAFVDSNISSIIKNGYSTVPIELDSNGSQIWNTTWGGLGSDEGRSVIVNSFNEIFVLVVFISKNRIK